MESVLVAHSDATTSQQPQTRPFVCSLSRKRLLAELIRKTQSCQEYFFPLTWWWRPCCAMKRNLAFFFFSLSSLPLVPVVMKEIQRGKSFSKRLWNQTNSRGIGGLSLHPGYCTPLPCTPGTVRPLSGNNHNPASSLTAAPDPWLSSPRPHTQYFCFLQEAFLNFLEVPYDWKLEQLKFKNIKGI